MCGPLLWRHRFLENDAPGLRRRRGVQLSRLSVGVGWRVSSSVTAAAVWHK